MPEPEALDARFAALRGLVRARNAETREQVLPDDFPVLVAPITNVRRPNAQEPGVIDITMDAGCFRWRPDHRNAEVREFCGHVADFLLARPPFEEVYTPGPQPSPQVG